MKNTHQALHLAISSMLAGGAIFGAGVAQADALAMEQCAGIVRAGMNDCATSTNACHSHVTTDSNPEAWVYLPKGTCKRISGAHVVNTMDPTPAKRAK